MNNLNLAIKTYLSVGNQPWGGERSFSEVEILKLDICNALLQSLGLSTDPTHMAIPLEPPTRALVVGFVYLMRNNRNGFHKIGFSKHPKARESTLQSEEPEVELVNSWPGTRADEAILHLKFQDKRLRGEWFNLAPDDIREIKGLTAQIANLDI